jgi:hypothetical protein
MLDKPEVGAHIDPPVDTEDHREKLQLLVNSTRASGLKRSGISNTPSTIAMGWDAIAACPGRHLGANGAER